MEDTKQVIIVRTDLNMPVGKIAAQVSHASMAFLTRGTKLYKSDMRSYRKKELYQFSQYYEDEFALEVNHWLQNSFTKICVGIPTGEDLLDLQIQLAEDGLHTELIIDNGKTCFNGEKTVTCMAVGPHYISKFAKTKHLKLL